MLIIWDLYSEQRRIGAGMLSSCSWKRVLKSCGFWFSCRRASKMVVRWEGVLIRECGKLPLTSFIISVFFFLSFRKRLNCIRSYSMKLIQPVFGVKFMARLYPYLCTFPILINKLFRSYSFTTNPQLTNSNLTFCHNIIWKATRSYQLMSCNVVANY